MAIGRAMLQTIRNDLTNGSFIVLPSCKRERREEQYPPRHNPRDSNRYGLTSGPDKLTAYARHDDGIRELSQRVGNHRPLPPIQA